MNSSIGRFLTILLSSAVLTKEGVSESNTKVQNKFKDVSPEGQEGLAELRRAHGGRSFVQSPMLYGNPGWIPPWSVQQQQQQQNQQKVVAESSTSRSHHISHAHGAISLDFADLAEDIGITEIRKSISGLNMKVDNMLVTLHDTIHNGAMNGLNPDILRLGSKTDYLVQAVQTMQAQMQAMHEQLQTERLAVQGALNNCPDFERPFQVLQNSISSVVQEVKHVRAYQSHSEKTILQAVAQNSDKLNAVHGGVQAALGPCSARFGEIDPDGSQTPPMSNIERKIDYGFSKIFTELANAAPVNMLRELHTEVTKQANKVISHSSHENEEIKSYLLGLATKMMDYRDEYLKRVIEQNKKMEVIRKTVTQTTEVMQHAAAQGAKGTVTSARRSLDSTSMCGGKNTKGK